MQEPSAAFPALALPATMEKTFARAALLAVALLAATAGLGLWMGDLHVATDPAVLRWGTVHRLSGMLTALVVLLVNSISVTYFIGTGRWCREVVETYGLDAALIGRSKRLKRGAFPFAVIGMLSMVGIVALGGAADPGGGLAAGSRAWVSWHLIGGIGLAAVIAWCFQAQLPAIRGQHDLIDEVMADVRRERAARGLDVAG
jgi:hypothetical protein